MGVEERGPGVDLGLELRIGVLEAELADIEVLRHLSRERHDAREVAGPEPMRRKPPRVHPHHRRQVAARRDACQEHLFRVAAVARDVREGPGDGRRRVGQAVRRLHRVVVRPQQAVPRAHEHDGVMSLRLLGPRRKLFRAARQAAPVHVDDDRAVRCVRRPFDIQDAVRGRPRIADVPLDSECASSRGRPFSQADLLHGLHRTGSDEGRAAGEVGAEVGRVAEVGEIDPEQRGRPDARLQVAAFRVQVVEILAQAVDAVVLLVRPPPAPLPPPRKLALHVRHLALLQRRKFRRRRLREPNRKAPPVDLQGLADRDEPRAEARRLEGVVLLQRGEHPVLRQAERPLHAVVGDAPRRHRVAPGLLEEDPRLRLAAADERNEPVGPGVELLRVHAVCALFLERHDIPGLRGEHFRQIRLSAISEVGAPCGIGKRRRAVHPVVAERVTADRENRQVERTSRRPGDLRELRHQRLRVAVADRQDPERALPRPARLRLAAVYTRADRTDNQEAENEKSPSPPPAGMRVHCMLCLHAAIIARDRENGQDPAEMKVKRNSHPVGVQIHPLSGWWAPLDSDQ